MLRRERSRIFARLADSRRFLESRQRYFVRLEQGTSSAFAARWTTHARRCRCRESPAAGVSQFFLPDGITTCSWRANPARTPPIYGGDLNSSDAVRLVDAQSAVICRAWLSALPSRRHAVRTALQSQEIVTQRRTNSRCGQGSLHQGRGRRFRRHRHTGILIFRRHGHRRHRPRPTPSA
jgi:hypothetical protein